MEIVNPADHASHEHRWLTRLGLAEPPPGADTWVPLARGFEPDGDGHTSTTAAELVDRLRQDNIESHQRPYRFSEVDVNHNHLLGAAGTAHMVIRVAVLVANHDLSAALSIAEQFERELRDRPSPEAPVSDAELTREALESPPPDDLAS